MVFSDYNTKFLDENGTNHLIKELKEYMNGLATGDIDLSDYVTKSELQAKLDSLNINIDLSSYATKEELTTAINSIDLSAYATKDEIPSIDGLATTEYVDNAVKDIPTGGNVDLSDYYNKEEIDAKITEIEPITTDEIKALFETEGLATKEDVSTAIDSIPPTDLTNYYNKEETYNKTEVDSLVANSSGSGSSGSSTGGSSDVYSTEETAIGTWIDGSTMYRKVIEYGKLASVSSGNYAIVPIEFDEEVSKITRMTALLEYSRSCIVVDGSFENVILSPSTTISTYVNDVEKSKFTFLGISAKKIYVYYGKNWSSYNATFILEYTKL